MKILRTAGLILFLTGFLVFNTISFLGSYRLTETSVVASIADEQRRELFLLHARGILNKPFASNFRFVKALDSVF